MRSWISAAGIRERANKLNSMYDFPVWCVSFNVCSVLFILRLPDEIRRYQNSFQSHGAKYLYLALGTSWLVSFYVKAYYWKMIQPFSQSNLFFFLRTKQGQQLPDQRARTVDKAASCCHDLPKGLVVFWLLAGADFPSCQMTVRPDLKLWLKVCVFFFFLYFWTLN